jgi:site-specific DNA-methyltransferase (adenine-specific)
MVGSKVILGDCVQLMKGYADNYFDLAIVDPPYGIREPAFRRNDANVKRKKATKTKEYNVAVYRQDAPDDTYFDELFRVSKNQIIWGGNYFGLRGSRCWIVWDKITYDAQWADGELAWTSFNSSVRIFQYAWNGMIQGDMKNKEIRIHPTQKPVSLYRWVLKNFAKEGNKILDTHLGSGSSRIAADKDGFDFTGFEIDNGYYEGQEKRFKQYKSQLRIEGW